MSRFWAWIKEQIVQDVPEHLAACEFDCRCVHSCRKNQCALDDDWKPRETRLYPVAQFLVETLSTPTIEHPKPRFNPDEAHSIS